jgi:hypothetical protein
LSPSQSAKPGWQAPSQTPLVQCGTTCEALQALPHPPQFDGSERTSVQTPLQRVLAQEPPLLEDVDAPPVPLLELLDVVLLLLELLEVELLLELLELLDVVLLLELLDVVLLLELLELLEVELLAVVLVLELELDDVTPPVPLLLELPDVVLPELDEADPPPLPPAPVEEALPVLEVLEVLEAIEPPELPHPVDARPRAHTSPTRRDARERSSRLGM